uniref:Reverse transcriptase domain-containing protein n=1 Tax=Plectus sambesii TaxID=2011161 RepID=A0A914W977_9BILA
MNSFFRKGRTRRWTWRSPNNQTFNEIDLLLTPDRRYISDVNVLAKFDAGSDHHLVQASFNYIASRTDAPRRPARKPPPEFNRLALKLKAAISLLASPCPTPAREYARLVDALTHAAHAAEQDVQLPTRISATTRTLFHRRRQLRFGLANTPHAAIQYAKLNKTLRKALAADLNAHHLCILEQAVAANHLRHARSELATGRTQVMHLRRRDGQHTTTTAEAAALVRTFYNNLYRSANGPFVYTPSSSVAWAEPLSTSEVFQALAQLKSQGAAGPDRVLPLAAKLAAPHLALPLCSLFNDMLTDDVIPPTLTAARKILLHKKGDTTDISNYRPISLLSVLYKSLTKVITWRIEAAVEHRLPPNQAGFRKGYSTLDHLHAVNMAVEKCREYNLRLSMLFVDFQKAFDTIEFRAIWNSLAHYGVDSSIIEVVKKLYASSSSIVTFASSEVDIDVQRGVRQGDTLSPKLFVLCLPHALDSIDWAQRGLKVGHQRPPYLAYADDIVLLSHDVD